MKKQIFNAAFLLILFLSFFGLTIGMTSGQQEQGSNNIHIETDSIAIDITGGQNVPKFSFWSLDDNETVYRVQFARIFEVLDNNSNGVYDKADNESVVPQSNQALAPLTWEFSEEVTSDGLTSFNITSSGADFTIQFRNHINESEANLKFDVVLEGYTWTSDDPSALFVLGFMLESSSNNASLDGNNVQFGEDAFFESVNTASTNDGDIGVSLSTGVEEESPMVYLAYEQFTGGFVHDPTIGVQAKTTSDVQGGDKNISVTTDAIGVNVTGGQNVPKFTFWSLNETDNIYHVQFSKIFEVVDENGNGVFDHQNETPVAQSNQALSPFSWTFSELSTEGGVTSFNITSEGGAFMIQFRNHIDESAASLKFDVVVDGYTWVSDDNNAMFVLAFKLESHNQSATQEGESVAFGDNAYFESEDEATSGNETISVGLSHATEEDSPMVYLAYSKFDSSFTHDPTIGVLYTSDLTDTSDGVGDDSSAGFGAELLVALATVLGVGAVFRKRQR